MKFVTKFSPSATLIGTVRRKRRASKSKIFCVRLGWIILCWHMRFSISTFYFEQMYQMNGEVENSIRAMKLNGVQSHIPKRLRSIRKLRYSCMIGTCSVFPTKYVSISIFHLPFCRWWKFIVSWSHQSSQVPSS